MISVSAVASFVTLYTGQTGTYTVNFASSPATAFQLRLKLATNMSGTVTSLDDTQATIAPSATQTVASNRIQFSVTPIAAPLSVQITFAASGAAASMYDFSSVEAVSASFLAQRVIAVSAPDVAYVGFPYTVSLTVAPPESGRVVVYVGSYESVEWTTNSQPTQNVTVTFGKSGLAQFTFAVALVDTSAYNTVVSPLAVRVEQPTTVDLSIPNGVQYIGEANRFSINATLSNHSSLDNLVVTLTSNATSGALGRAPVPHRQHDCR